MTFWERWRWQLVAVWAAVILVATSVPVPALAGPPVPNVDKLAHVLLYLPLGLLTFVALRRELPRRSTLFIILITSVACAAFAAADEWHQQFVSRTASVLDWYADLVGTSIGNLSAAAYDACRRGRS